MSIQAILAVVGIIVLLIIAGTLQRTLTNYFGSKAIAATQKGKPKSKLQKWLGW